MDTIKDRNGKELTEAEDSKKRWLYKKKIFMIKIIMML